MSLLYHVDFSSFSDGTDVHNIGGTGGAIWFACRSGFHPESGNRNVAQSDAIRITGGRAHAFSHSNQTVNARLVVPALAGQAAYRATVKFAPFADSSTAANNRTVNIFARTDGSTSTADRFVGVRIWTNRLEFIRKFEGSDTATIHNLGTPMTAGSVHELKIEARQEPGQIEKFSVWLDDVLIFDDIEGTPFSLEGDRRSQEDFSFGMARLVDGSSVGGVMEVTIEALATGPDPVFEEDFSEHAHDTKVHELGEGAPGERWFVTEHSDIGGRDTAGDNGVKVLSELARRGRNFFSFFGTATLEAYDVTEVDEYTAVVEFRPFGAHGTVGGAGAVCILPRTDNSSTSSQLYAAFRIWTDRVEQHARVGGSSSSTVHDLDPPLDAGESHEAHIRVRNVDGHDRISLWIDGELIVSDWMPSPFSLFETRRDAEKFAIAFGDSVTETGGVETVKLYEGALDPDWGEPDPEDPDPPPPDPDPDPDEEGLSAGVERRRYLVAVDNGNIYYGNSPILALAVEGAGRLANDRPPQAIDAAGRVYFVDGEQTLELLLKTGVVSDLEAGEEKGEVPAGCRIITLWRDRLCLANHAGFEQNLYLSRSGDHQDWDYAAEDALAAVALNASQAGRIGQPIHALIPFRDDVLIIGCDSSIWQLTGDPAAGGSLDAVSEAVGIFGPDAWTFDPSGILWFVGTGGLYRMSAVAGAAPENLTSGRVAQFFASIDRIANHIVVRWDPDRHGCWVFITPRSSGPAIHLFFDARTDGFFPVRFPVSQGPVSAIVFDGDGPDERHLLVGGRDGYVRRLDADALSDDGDAIESHVTIGPAIPTGDSQEAILTMFEAVLATHDNTRLVAELLTGADPQGALAATPTPLATWDQGGRRGRLYSRRRACTFYAKLSNAQVGTTWSLERLSAVAMPGGLAR